MHRRNILRLVAVVALGFACGRDKPLDEEYGTGGARSGARSGGRSGAGGQAQGSGGANGVAGRGAGATSGTGTGGAAGTQGSGGRAGSGGVTGSGGRTGSGGSGGLTGSGGSAGAAPPGTGGTGGPGGSGGIGAAACGTPGVLYSGTQRVIGVFVVEAGYLVVRSDAVVLYGRDKQVRKMVASPREITAAAVDGTTLVVADKAQLNVLSTGLQEMGTVLVTETCVSGVLVGGGRFVCGPQNDWDRIFYTFDVATTPPKQIAVSNKYTYNGIPMRRVPGTDDFVTVTTGLSPSDFHLYHVDETGKAVFINESPYHGDFAATMTFAFDGTPPSHLIQSAGLLLKIYGTGCTSMMNVFNSQCFVKDGALGTLTGTQGFIGLADDGGGRLFAVVSPGNIFVFDSPCKAGCAVQRIDVPSRLIVSQKTHTIANMLQVLGVVGDPGCGSVVVHYSIPDPTATYQAGGYAIGIFDY